MTDFLKEIEEDIRRARLEALWNRVGKTLVAASLVVVLLTIVYVVWQDQRQGHAIEQTSRLINGMDRLQVEDYKGAIDAFDALAKDASSVYYAMAMLGKAQAYQSLGDKQSALQAYQELSEKGKGDSSDFAALAKVLAAHGDDNVIEPEEGSTFYYSQSEWRAWQLVAHGKTADAVALFAAIANDVNAPGSMRVRAASVLNNLMPGKEQ